MKIREMHIVYLVLSIAIFELATIGSERLRDRAPSFTDPNLVALSSGEERTVPFGGSPAGLPAGIARAAATVPAAEKEPAKPLPAPHPEYPARLVIPSLEVNAAIQTVGLAKSGNISAPSRFSDVGWFIRSALPGELGSVVMDGHVDNGIFRSGVFKHLDRMREGDEVVVKNREGKSFRYVVTRVAIYPYDNVPMADIIGQRDIRQLVLITCAGEWIKDEKTYDQRLVVYAALAE